MLAREKLDGALDTLICREVLEGTIEFSELRCNAGFEFSRPQSRELCFDAHRSADVMAPFRRLKVWQILAPQRLAS